MSEPRTRAPWRLAGVAVIGALLLAARPAAAFPTEALESVVSVLPLWPGRAQGGAPNVPPGTAPEGSGVAILPDGYIATALHVIDTATKVSVRLADGRILPAEVVGRDAPTDLALLKTEADLPVLQDAPEPGIGAPACAIGNQFGLDLTVTCGVVSAVHRSGVGLNPVEDFVQTDAVVNPGGSGGALIDAEGRLLGILTAIFTKTSDADIGINFAASMPLVRRVVEDLAEHGRVVRVRTGLRAGDLALRERRFNVGAVVIGILPDSPAARSGLVQGDLVTGVGDRPVRKAADLTSALESYREDDTVDIVVQREGNPVTLKMELTR